MTPQFFPLCVLTQYSMAQHWDKTLKSTDSMINLVGHWFSGPRQSLTFGAQILASGLIRSKGRKEERILWASLTHR